MLTDFYRYPATNSIFNTVILSLIPKCWQARRAGIKFTLHMRNIVTLNYLFDKIEICCYVQTTLGYCKVFSLCGLYILKQIEHFRGGFRHKNAIFFTLFESYFSLMFYQMSGFRNVTKTCQHEHIKPNLICMKFYVNWLDTFEITIKNTTKMWRM